MSTEIGRLGNLSATLCFSRCDACNEVKKSIQYTGPNGYVTVCFTCVADGVIHYPENATSPNHTLCVCGGVH